MRFRNQKASVKKESNTRKRKAIELREIINITDVQIEYKR